MSLLWWHGEKLEWCGAHEAKMSGGDSWEEVPKAHLGCAVKEEEVKLRLVAL